MSSTQSEPRYAVCPNCGVLFDMVSNNLLRVAVPCHTCFYPNAFGPKVFFEDFRGYTLKDARTISNKVKRRLRV